MPTELVSQLPNELLDEIFQLAARESHSTAITLMQISKWVSNRIEPVLYEVIAIEQTGFSPHFFLPPHIEKLSSGILDVFKQYGHHVRYLSIEPSQPEPLIVPTLNLCPSLRNLKAPVDLSAEMIEIVQVHLPHLKRISGRFTQHFASLDASKPLWRHLTHLDMIGDHYWSDCSTFLPHLSSLTHLALNDPELNDGSREDEMVLGPLRDCRRLEALLLVSEPAGLLEACKERNYEPADDRVVAVGVKALEDWLNGVRGGFDMWAHADRIIGDRRKTRNDSSGA
ncbi:hypothetical protein BDN72DRAFT_840313 [Pluteus cervinus]|uniref:Uncharacterized protein n=1 Tax=Pluteus cervinus TaxID=181527 RepID=A0ACD3AUU0_9AGAR|nr:hypothetical protein BDN72DRAFT_840313 [Pluteus cervinus]